jgi:hypothetical protein
VICSNFLLLQNFHVSKVPLKMDKRKKSVDTLGYNPFEDPQFADTVQDLLTIYKPSELEEEPYLPTYVKELLARWGRWHSRGRAPALCFEAACVGGRSYLERIGQTPSELTSRADLALARLLAGIVIDEVEPMARSQGGAVRQKAVAIVADEFLARTATPKVAKVLQTSYFSLQKRELKIDRRMIRCWGKMLDRIHLCNHLATSLNQYGKILDGINVLTYPIRPLYQSRPQICA